MMRRWGWVGLCVGMAWAVPAFASTPGKCNQIAELTGGNNAITTNSARVCSVEFFATAASGWVQVYDQDPNAAVTTRVTVAEPGTATSGNHEFIDFGPDGFITQYGLGADVRGGRAIIRYGR